MIDQRLKAFIIHTLRRASYRWYARNEALRLSRVERGFYKCAACKQTFARKEVQIDHINPVVKITGFTTWDDYINRLFCPVEGLQILCLTCHDSKTLIEQNRRKKHKKTLTKSKKSSKIK